MKRIKNKSQRGFSVLEVIIVLVIISILVVFAVAQFDNASTVFDTQNVARELKVSLERARFDSVKRRPNGPGQMATIVLNSPTSFSVTYDRNQDGLLDPEERMTINYAGRSNARIVGNALAYPVTVWFDMRGHATARNSLGNTINPRFLVCDGCSSFADAEMPTSYYISLSPTGTVAMYDNGRTPATLSTPATTSIGTNTDIEPMASTAVGALNQTGMTNVPTGSVTPTPTPTVVYCVYNERPSVTGCVCRSPMKVTGGRCR